MEIYSQHGLNHSDRGQGGPVSLKNTIGKDNLITKNKVKDMTVTPKNTTGVQSLTFIVVLYTYICMYILKVYHFFVMVLYCFFFSPVKQKTKLETLT